MTTIRRSAWVLLTTLLLIASPCSIGSAGAAERSDRGQLSMMFRTAVRHLPVQAHSHDDSYDRDLDFGDWASQGGGCDTRAVVLTEESTVPVTATDECVVLTGRWRSYYDGTVYTHAEDLQIDHVVPAKNAWVSGAWRWSQARRIAYYNDLGDPRSLVAVDAHDNESKGDQTPEEWLPPSNRCRYVREFTAVKLRWELTVTRREKRALKHEVAQCRNVRITVASPQVPPSGAET